MDRKTSGFRIGFRRSRYMHVVVNEIDTRSFEMVDCRENDTIVCVKRVNCFDKLTIRLPLIWTVKHKFEAE